MWVVGPVHIGFSEAVFAAIGQAHSFLGKFETAIPVKGGPEAVFASGDGSEQVIVLYVIWLFGDVKFEGEDFCGLIADAARGLVDVGNAILAERVAEQVAVFVIAVEPEIGGREVLVVHELTLDLEVDEVVVLASFLPSLRPVPGEFGRVFDAPARECDRSGRQQLKGGC